MHVLFLLCSEIGHSALFTLITRLKKCMHRLHVQPHTPTHTFSQKSKCSLYHAIISKKNTGKMLLPSMMPS